MSGITVIVPPDRIGSGFICLHSSKAATAEEVLADLDEYVAEVQAAVRSHRMGTLSKLLDSTMPEPVEVADPPCMADAEVAS